MPTQDTATVIGRLAAAQQRTEAMLNLMKAMQPKLEAFYATLDDTQKASFNQMGPRGTVHASALASRRQ